MAQYVYTMNKVSKTVPPKRQILKDISLSFFPGAKIGVLGLNGSGKSSLLKIMAGVDKEIEGEAIPMPGLTIGYLEQEPKLNPEHTVRESVEEAMSAVNAAKKRLDEVYELYAAEDADFDALAAEQAELEAIIATAGTDSEHQLEIAADALRLPPWDAKISLLSGGECSASRAPWWPSPTTATSWTTRPSGSWNWTAAVASPGRATTAPGWKARKPAWRPSRRARKPMPRP
jgi:energy-dependent translational throttle protein EttA